MSMHQIICTQEEINQTAQCSLRGKFWATVFYLILFYFTLLCILSKLFFISKLMIVSHLLTGHKRKGEIFYYGQLTEK